MNFLSKCYNVIKILCKNQFEKVPDKDVNRRNKIEKVLKLLNEYEEELVEYDILTYIF